MPISINKILVQITFAFFNRYHLRPLHASMVVHAHPHPPPPLIGSRKQLESTCSPPGPGQAGRPTSAWIRSKSPTDGLPAVHALHRTAAAAHTYPPPPPALFSLASPASCSSSTSSSSSSLHSPPNLLSPFLLSSHRITSPSGARVRVQR
jgi:hypothetical protein